MIFTVKLNKIIDYFICNIIPKLGNINDLRFCQQASFFISSEIYS